MHQTTPSVSSRPETWGSSLDAVARTLLNIGAAAILAAVTLVFYLLLIPLKLMLRDTTPLFFTEERLGRNLKPFQIIKFNTLDPARLNGTHVILDDDIRTKPGRIIRPFHIDELPQSFNVLRRQMAIVGWRPMPRHHLQPGDENKYHAMFTTRPGITHAAAVRREVELAEIVDKVTHDAVAATIRKIDNDYAGHQTFWTDLWVIILTVGVIIRGHGV